MHKLLRYTFIGIIFPILVQYVFYFQFTPSYTQDLFSKQKFERFYSTSVYGSRQLGKRLHLWVYEKLASNQKLKNYGANPYNSKRLLHTDADADAVFYLTYFFLACFFSVLTALTLLFLLQENWLFGDTQHYKDLVVLFFALLIGFTQFVVTPYDNPGYFFQALAMLFFVKYLKSRNIFFYISLLLLIVLATTNRETSLLILSFMAAIYLAKEGWKWAWIRKMILPVLCFGVTYLSLKLSMPGAPAITDVSQWRINLNLTNPWSMMGLLFALLVIYLSLYTFNLRKQPLARNFLFFSLPYLVLIPTVGLMVEYRLWVPVLEAVLILSIMKLSAFKEDRMNSAERNKKSGQAIAN